MEQEAEQKGQKKRKRICKNQCNSKNADYSIQSMIKQIKEETNDNIPYLQGRKIQLFQFARLSIFTKWKREENER